MKKIFKSRLLLVIVTMLLSITGSILATTSIMSNQVIYNNEKTAETTVKGSLDELFSAVDINNRLGSTNISSIGNGTVTDAISALNTNLSNKLSLSGGTLTGTLNVGQKLQLWTDSEGGNINIISPNSQVWQLDSKNNTSLRIFNFKQDGTAFGKTHSFSDSGFISGGDVITASGNSLDTVSNQIKTKVNKTTTNVGISFLSNYAYYPNQDKVFYVQDDVAHFSVAVTITSSTIPNGVQTKIGTINPLPNENVFIPLIGIQSGSVGSSCGWLYIDTSGNVYVTQFGTSITGVFFTGMYNVAK